MLRPGFWAAHFASASVVRLLSAVCVSPILRLVMFFSKLASSDLSLAVQRLNAPGVADGYFALIRKL